jgi:nitrous oxidase accessory protein NosD
MRVSSSWRLGALTAVALSAAVVCGVTAGTASAWHSQTPPTLFVNGSMLSGYDHDPCGAAPYATISAAVDAGAPGSRIIVCPGTYKEDVTVTKPLVIEGIHATVDATALDNGFTLSAPSAGTRIEGFTIENAVGEGVRAVSTHNVSIVNNTIENNDKGVSQANTDEECIVSPKNPVPDCGEGVHLMGTASSQIIGNTIRNNSGGVLMTDETGPTDGNVVAHNQVLNNIDDCGITLAGHNPAAAPGGTPNPAAGGVYGNLIEDNVAVGNGTAGQGGGVLLAAGIPIGGGAVYNNTVSENFLKGNGLAGVTLHNHVPGQDLNGNKIVDNVIATNNLDGDPDFAPVMDPSTTGIFVGTAGSPLTITIQHNVIYSNEVGIFLTGALNTEQINRNLFFGVTTHIVGP